MSAPIRMEIEKMTQNRLRHGLWLAAAAAVATSAVSASAQMPAAPAATEAAPLADAPPPGLWINGIHLSAQIEGGITGNPAGPKNNFGQLFTDKPNTFLLNQILLTANKPLDPKAPGFDWGFKLQGMYGSDARYTQFLGELNRVNPGDRNQLDVVEANVLFHLPVLFEGGVDIKAGQYTTPIGFETIDPSTNLFYSHSYIFNFGIPLKHTGVLTTSHVSSLLDVYLGADTGVNTTFGPLGDNNGAVAFLGGVNLTMMDGNLTVLALTHLGPENPTRALSPAGFNANGYFRYLNDIIVTYKATPQLTFVTEFNWIRDDFDGIGVSGVPKTANGFGVAQYVSYALSDQLTLNGRGEIYRDDNNFFVASFQNAGSFVAAQQGFAVGAGALRATTYGALTVGVTYKPAGLPPVISGLMIRPEVRWDTDLGGNKAFNSNKDNSQVTLASDFVLTF
jgi:Putative beta-barrel porin-2, OmpL-like. bbp2